MLSTGWVKGNLFLSLYNFSNAFTDRFKQTVNMGMVFIISEIELNKHIQKTIFIAFYHQRQNKIDIL